MTLGIQAWISFDYLENPGVRHSLLRFLYKSALRREKIQEHIQMICPNYRDVQLCLEFMEISRSVVAYMELKGGGDFHNFSVIDSPLYIIAALIIFISGWVFTKPCLVENSELSFDLGISCWHSLCFHLHKGSYEKKAQL